MKVHILEANTRKARSPICNCFNIGTGFGPRIHPKEIVKI